MKLLETEVQIDASPQIVWRILTDLERYPEWNPFIKKARGKVQVGEKLEVCIAPPGGKEMIFKPVVLAVRENVEFRWLGRVLAPGLLDGEHFFTITGDGDGCRFEQNEVFRGMLVPLLWRGMARNTLKGFEMMNAALKERAEGFGT
jgi:hypothetical protein